MAPKSTPFKVVIHFAGKKSESDIQNLYTDFYIDAVKNSLMNGNLSEELKRCYGASPRSFCHTHPGSVISNFSIRGLYRLCFQLN